MSTQPFSSYDPTTRQYSNRIGMILRDALDFAHNEGQISREDFDLATSFLNAPSGHFCQYPQGIDTEDGFWETMIALERIMKGER